MGDPGQKENSQREEKKQIERMGKFVAPALNPVEQPRPKTSFSLALRHVSTGILSQSGAVKKKIQQANLLATAKSNRWRNRIEDL
jgi:hypothetical protein